VSVVDQPNQGRRHDSPFPLGRLAGEGEGATNSSDSVAYGARKLLQEEHIGPRTVVTDRRASLPASEPREGALLTDFALIFGNNCLLDVALMT